MTTQIIDWHNPHNNTASQAEIENEYEFSMYFSQADENSDSIPKLAFGVKRKDCVIVKSDNDIYGIIMLKIHTSKVDNNIFELYIFDFDYTFRDEVTIAKYL